MWKEAWRLPLQSCHARVCRHCLGFQCCAIEGAAVGLNEEVTVERKERPLELGMGWGGGFPGD